MRLRLVGDLIERSAIEVMDYWGCVCALGCCFSSRSSVNDMVLVGVPKLLDIVSIKR